MPIHRETTNPDSTEAAISAFLDAHYAHELVNDGGPLLGRLASLRGTSPHDAFGPQLWQEAISAALTGQSSPAGR